MVEGYAFVIVWSLLSGLFIIVMTRFFTRRFVKEYIESHDYGQLWRRIVYVEAMLYRQRHLSRLLPQDYLEDEDEPAECAPRPVPLRFTAEDKAWFDQLMDD
jgi:hypothetical protein